MSVLDRALFDCFPWERTLLGARSKWPAELHFMCDFLLCSKQPMFMLWGPERLFIHNGPYQQAWSIESLDGLGRPIAEVAPAVWAQLGPEVERVFEGESFIESDFRIADEASGHVRYFDFSYTPLRTFDLSQVTGALCIASEVTERFVAEERREKEREILALTVENVTEGVALVESDLSLVLWNEPFRLHFGYAPGELQPRMDAMQLMLKTARRGDLGPGDPVAIVEGLARSIRTGPSARLEIERANGKILSLYRISLSGGRFLLVSRDVTDERKATRLKDELVSTVSHELRTPLTAISGALGMVAAGAAGTLPEKAEKLVRIAQRNSERLAALVDDLLDMDKLRSGKVQFRKERCDFREVVRAAVEQNLPVAERAAVRLQADLPDSPLVGEVDQSRIIQVLTNLISNAVKFSPAGETVVVRARDMGGRARISVIDNGSGVSEEFRARLFERFTQQDGTSSKVQQGTGLGLAISKSIAEAHGGTVQLDPTTASGATFYLDLPLSQPR